MIRTVLITALAAVALASAAGGVWLAGAGTAMAPEPAQLTQNLSGWDGATAAATYVNTNVSTSVVKWPSSYRYGTLAAGTPCSPYDLGAWSQVTGVIVATGNYRKCA